MALRHVGPILLCVKYVLFVLLAAAAVVLNVAPAGAQAVGPAVVQTDASLIVNGRRFVLADIVIVPAGRTCDTGVLPATCGSPAYLALRRQVQHFVACRPRFDLPDPDVAECRHNARYPSGGEDLGAFLIAEGWATASPTARPFYQTLEQIARSQGRGVWGTRVDELIAPAR